MWNAGVKKHIESSSAWKDPRYFSDYINKYFSDELSEETQASLTSEEKFVVLKKIKDFLIEKVTNKIKNAAVSMITSEMLHLSIKLEQFDEEIFKEYIAYPLENNSNLLKEESKKEMDAAK